MKNIIKTTVVVLLIAFSIPSFAQTFGVKAGLNLANMLDKDDDETYSNDYKMNPGFHAGVTMDYPFTDLLSLETGLLLTTKGMRIEEEELGMKVTGKANLYYLDIPITLKGAYDLGGVKMYVAIGPYIGIGLSGKIKTTIEYQGDKETEVEDVNWGSDENSDDLKRVDLGFAFGGGVEINAIQIGVSYGLGLANISSYTEGGTKFANRVLGISVGYRFGGNK